MSSFCGKCGARVADPTDTYCRECGAGLIVTASDAKADSSGGATSGSAAAGQLAMTAERPGPEMTWQLSKRPWWPWVPVALGILLIAVFGLVGIVSYGDMQDAQGLGLFGGEIPPNRIDAPISSYSAMPYEEARDAFVGSIMVASLGLLLCRSGLAPSIEACH